MYIKIVSSLTLTIGVLDLKKIRGLPKHKYVYIRCTVDKLEHICNDGCD